MRRRLSDRPVASLPGIGPKTARWLGAIGIESEAGLRALGAAAAYRQLKQHEPQAVTLNALWAMHGALAGIPWASIPPDDKARLKHEVRDG